MGAGMAELLAGEGHAVELVTSCEKVAPFCDETLEGPLLRQHLHDLGIGMRAECAVLGRRRRAACAARRRSATPSRSSATPLSSSRSACPTTASSSSSARPAPPALHRIGDCVAPRLLADAIWDGHRLAREIDSPDPAMPLPHLRERPAETLAQA